jgi:hypothetical protein
MAAWATQLRRTNEGFTARMLRRRWARNVVKVDPEVAAWTLHAATRRALGTTEGTGLFMVLTGLGGSHSCRARDGRSEAGAGPHNAPIAAQPLHPHPPVTPQPVEPLRLVSLRLIAVTQLGQRLPKT